MADGPTDKEIHMAMLQAMEQMRLHSVSLTELVDNLNTEIKIHRAQIKNMAVSMDESTVIANANSDVINENEERIQQERNIAAGKEIIDHLFDKGHQYVTVVIGGAFAAYFATLSTLAQRFSDNELRVSALLMTSSLTAFVLWEIITMFYMGHHSMKGDYGAVKAVPRWQRIGWYVAMFLTLGTALPAIALSVFVYLRGLGALP